MNKDELRKLIAETITQMGYYSPQATELLLGTCAQESHLGKYRIHWVVVLLWVLCKWNQILSGIFASDI